MTAISNKLLWSLDFKRQHRTFEPILPKASNPEPKQEMGDYAIISFLPASQDAGNRIGHDARIWFKVKNV
jgi:hypothetical protein